MRLILLFFCTTTLMSAQSWQQEGALKRWTGGETITSSAIGCISGEGNPIVDLGSKIGEVNLTSGAVTEHSRGDQSSLVFLPRSPKVFLQVTHDANRVTLAYKSSTSGADLGTVSANVDASALQVDQADTWISDDGIEGCVVFAPSASTPEEKKEYVILVFRNQSVSFMHRVKPKVDVDIYVQPNTDDGLVCYLRGNGMSFLPSAEEVFTNGSYLRYDASGRRTRLDLPTRGPGSGKGRSIIWSSVKWDRLLIIDEFASGALLVKASNGIVVDSITSSQLAPGENVKILSASGNINDRWMATHARVGTKNAITLWAMPETKEVTSVEFAASDASKKQMPLSPWTIVIPFLSSADGNNTLFSWNPQDVVSVDEEQIGFKSTAYPLPATDQVTITLPQAEGTTSYRVISSIGDVVLEGTAQIEGGKFVISTSSLGSGLYTVTSTPAHQHTSILIKR